MESKLYIEGAARSALGLRSRPRNARACPCCGNPDGFCAANQAILDRVRGSLAEDRAKTRSVGNGGRKKALAPRCCTLGCDAPRIRGEAFCDACSDAGAVQEAD